MSLEHSHKQAAKVSLEPTPSQPAKTEPDKDTVGLLFACPFSKALSTCAFAKLRAELNGHERYRWWQEHPEEWEQLMKKHKACAALRRFFQQPGPVEGFSAIAPLLKESESQKAIPFRSKGNDTSDDKEARRIS